MKKVFLTLLVLVSIQMSSIAQETKPGCNPKACKPGNTKVEEAVAITNLRSETQSRKAHFAAKYPEFSNAPIEQGSTETESLEIIALEINELEEKAGRSKTDFSQYSGARLVKRLKSAIKGVQN